jgi:hypothetical protein
MDIPVPATCRCGSAKEHWAREYWAALEPPPDMNGDLALARALKLVAADLIRLGHPLPKKALSKDSTRHRMTCLVAFIHAANPALLVPAGFYPLVPAAVCWFHRIDKTAGSPFASGQNSPSMPSSTMDW